ncbi:hypothetical protein TKK_0003568 [Trichogramma kaykai]|uniref:Calponin-homology (CH) domain-containing protein n=1 Tax=Trichogramma kaykai TaxID=54128 RepID=A0ABD2XPN5_9HYME
MNVDTELRGDDIREIYAWLDEIPLSRPKRNVTRDFSDGVLIAEILKRYYPKIVDIKNYIPASNTMNKIDNWSTLNRKVFPKINMKLSPELIKRLAQSQPGVIERVLYEIRTKIIKDCNADRNALFKDCEEGCIIELDASNPEDSLNQMVPRKVFIKLKKESDEKTNTICALQKRIDHLETMLAFKEQQIEDLTAQLVSSFDKM